MDHDIGSLKARLRTIEAELGRMPVWERGSPRASRLASEARHLQDRIERTRLHRRWVVPEGTGSLARFRLEIPRSG